MHVNKSVCRCFTTHVTGRGTLLRAREVIFGTVLNCVGVAVRSNQCFVWAMPQGWSPGVMLTTHLKLLPNIKEYGVVPP